MSFVYCKTVLALNFLKPGFCIRSPLGAFGGICFEKRLWQIFFLAAFKYCHGMASIKKAFPFLLSRRGKLLAQGQSCPGLHQKQRGQQGEEGDSAPLLRSAETPPEVLHPALEPSAQEGHGPVGAGPEEATKMIQGLEPLLWGKAERVGAVQPAKENAAGRPYCSLSVTEGGLVTGACSARTRGNGFKLKEGKFRLDARLKFFPMRVVKHWHWLPREAVAAPSLELFKARLDGALSNLV